MALSFRGNSNAVYGSPSFPREKPYPQLIFSIDIFDMKDMVDRDRYIHPIAIPGSHGSSLAFCHYA